MNSTHVEPQALTLLQLNQLVEGVIRAELSDDYWVVAELADVKEKGGHCYMELIERAENGNTTVARASAKCWNSQWMQIKPYFQRVTGQPLCSGMKLMVRVRANFHPNYGFSWIVNNIEPTFTLGDMARKRQEIVRILKQEGIFNDNRTLPFPMFAQRIAVVSSEGAAGYGDFCKQLAGNNYGYRFRIQLFQAVMQGESVEDSIIAALEEIYLRMDDFDCVVIVRGGGATTDLSGFDALDLARVVAQFPLPVITAIGHERDESVLDLIANVRVKTPTAAAAFLIDHLKRVDDRLDSISTAVIQLVKQRLYREHQRLAEKTTRLTLSFATVRTKGENRITALFQAIAAKAGQKVEQAQHKVEVVRQRMESAVTKTVTVQKHRLDLCEQRTKALDPQTILRRGYSITTHKGKAVKDVGQLAPGDEITTRLAMGTLTSVVKTANEQK